MALRDFKNNIKWKEKPNNWNDFEYNMQPFQCYYKCKNEITEQKNEYFNENRLILSREFSALNVELTIRWKENENGIEINVGGIWTEKKEQKLTKKVTSLNVPSTISFTFLREHPAYCYQLNTCTFFFIFPLQLLY